MGQCGTAVVGEGTELGVQRVIHSTGEGVVGRAKAAATVRVEVVAAVSNVVAGIAPPPPQFPPGEGLLATIVFLRVAVPSL